MITTLLYSNEIRASPDTAAHVRVDIVNTGSTAVQPGLDVIGLPEGWVAPVSDPRTTRTSLGGATSRSPFPLQHRMDVTRHGPSR